MGTIYAGVGRGEQDHFLLKKKRSFSLLIEHIGFDEV
jgi:hypothetical protein